MKSLAIFGSTGSIGETALKVYSQNNKKFNLVFLSAHTNFKKLIKQQKKYRPKKIILTGNNKNFNNKITDKEFLFYNYKKKIDYTISGVSGYDAVDLNFKLLKISKNLLIANKETIICGGNFFLDSAKKNNCKIIPIDSEHHCLNFLFTECKIKQDNIKKIYITASGGPFLKKKIKHNESIASVINHPNWKMGKKISVNSSNFSNKVLELFEAKILFNIHPKKLFIKVEDSSLVHSIICFENNIYLPIMHYQSMEIPISNSLKLENNCKLNFTNIKINILNPNINKFPIIKIGYEILNKFGHKGMIFFTVINDRLVDMFLKKEIKYGDIAKNLIKVFSDINIKKKLKLKINNLDEVYISIQEAKNVKI